MSSYLNKLDLFGEPVRVNFRGETEFRTARGGVLSLLTMVLTLFASLQLLQSLIHQTDPTISVYEIYDTENVQEQEFDLIQYY